MMFGMPRNLIHNYSREDRMLKLSNNQSKFLKLCVPQIVRAKSVINCQPYWDTLSHRLWHSLNRYKLRAFKAHWTFSTTVDFWERRDFFQKCLWSCIKAWPQYSCVPIFVSLHLLYLTFWHSSVIPKQF